MADTKQETAPETITISMASTDYTTLIEMAKTGVCSAIAQLLSQPNAVRNIHQTTTEALRVLDAAKPTE